MYRKSIITFLDILGFRSLIESRPFDKIQTALKVLKNVSQQFIEEIDENSFSRAVIQFSDSIVRVRPLLIGNDHAPSPTFYAEICDLIRTQGFMAQHGICIRGAVTVGDVHIDKSGAFGPGFIRAYELESTLALYPRIVIDPIFFPELSAHLERHGSESMNEEAGIKFSLRRGDDGLHWIDYFRRYIQDFVDPENTDIFVAAHKKLIIDNAPSKGVLSSIALKYLWLARYHNTSIDEMSPVFRIESKLDNMRISENEFPLLHSSAP